MHGQRTQKEKQQALQLSGHILDHNVESGVIIDKANPSFNISVALSPETTLHANAYFDDPSYIKAEFYHDTNNERVDDALLSVRLYESRIIRANSFIRPGIKTDVQVSIKNELSIMLYVSSVC